jgi:hypothetical protein
MLIIWKKRTIDFEIWSDDPIYAIKEILEKESKIWKILIVFAIVIEIIEEISKQSWKNLNDF